MSNFLNPYRFGFTVGHSGSFVAASSQSMSQVWGAGRSQTKFTIAAWVKRASLTGGSYQIICGNTTGDPGFGFNPSDQLIVRSLSDSGSTFSVFSSASFTSTTAFYHVVFACDTSQGTAAQRIRMYVDGNEVTYGASTNPGLNANMGWGTNGGTGYLGRRGSSASLFFDGLLAELYYIDNQQLTPSSFRSAGGHPIAYTGVFGSKDIYLPFANSGALGTDASGNGFNFTNSGVTQSTTVPT